MTQPHFKRLALVITLVLLVLGASFYLMAKPSEDPYAQLYDGKIDILFRQGASISPQRLQEIVSSVGGTVIFRDPALGEVAIMLNPRPKTIVDADKLVRQLERYPEVESATAATEALKPN